MKIIKTNSGYIVEAEVGDTNEQMISVAFKLFVEGNKNEQK